LGLLFVVLGFLFTGVVSLESSWSYCSRKFLSLLENFGTNSLSFEASLFLTIIVPLIRAELIQLN